MCTFAVGKIEQLSVKEGRVRFLKLYKNDICFFDEFVKDVARNINDRKKLKNIFAYMDFLALRDQKLPASKINTIRHGNKKIGFEFKQGDLRVYCVEREPNIIVVLGGYKKTQKKDIRKFRRLIDEAYEFLSKDLKIKNKR